MMRKAVRNIIRITFLGFISINSIFSAETKHTVMNMESKDMNGMEMEGNDGIMNKADMKRMNKVMSDCMEIHKNPKL